MIKKVFNNEFFQLFLFVGFVSFVFWYVNIHFTTDSPLKVSPLIVEIIRAIYTILLFFLGQQFTKQRDVAKSRKEKKDLRKYIYTIIEYFDNPFKRQIENMKKYINQIKNNDNYFFIYYTDPSFSIKNITQLNQSNLFSAFVLSINGDSSTNSYEFANFQFAIDFFDATIDKNLPEIYGGFSKDISSLKQLYDTESKKIQSIFQNYISQIEQNEQEDNLSPVSKAFIEFTLGYANEVTGDPEKCKTITFDMEKSIKPLFQICVKNLDDKRCSELLESLIDCQNKFKNMEKIRNFYAKICVELIEEMEEQKLKIDHAVKYFKNIDR
jgi:hypothetical protein